MTIGSIAYFAKRYTFTVSQFAYRATAGVLSVKGRDAFKAMSDDMGYADVPSRLPCRRIDEIVDVRRPVRMVWSEAARWNVSTDEMAVLNLLVSNFRPRTLFEMGTFDGRTTLNLVLNAPPEAQMCTIDLPPRRRTLPDERTVGQFFRNHESASRITQLFGDSLEYDFSPYFGNVDFVLVDAGHSYHNVQNDSKVAFEMIRGRANAVIVWHDYRTIQGVTRAVDELISTGNPPAAHFAQIRGTRFACWVSASALG